MAGKLSILCIVLCTAAFALAQPSRHAGGSDRGERADSPRHPEGQTWGPADWKAFRERLAKFCLENSPNRWKDIEGKGRSYTGMAMRFGALQQLEKENPKHYQVKVKQIQVEDREYGLLKQLKEAKDSQAAELIKQDLRKCARESIELGLQDKAFRIERLEKMLQSQKEQLKQDEGRVEVLASERTEKMISEGTRFFFPPPPGPGPGAGRRDPGEGPASNPAQHGPAAPVNVER